MMMFLFLLLTVVTATPHYNVIPRIPSAVRNLVMIDESDISFDGNVDEIKELAMQKAMGDGLDPFSCSGYITSHMELLTFQYSVEYESGSDLEVIRDNLEKTLQIALAPRLLICVNANAEDAQIIAERAEPLDLLLNDESCPPDTTNEPCKMYQGRMQLFLADQQAVSEAVYLARTYIQILMDADDNEVPNENLLAMQVGNGLIKATYLGPDPVNPNDGIVPIDVGDTNRDADTLGTASLALVAVASAAFVVLVGMGIVWRRSRRQAASADGAATQMAGSSFHEDSMISTVRPSSPFSEMLPSAYRFNENMSILSAADSGLSAVMESGMSDDEAAARSPDGTNQNESIILSESGYTTEAEGTNDDQSFDLPTTLYTTTTTTKPNKTDSPELLGARKRNSDADAPMSDISSDSESPIKRRDTPMLTPEKDEEEQADAELLFLSKSETKEEE